MRIRCEKTCKDKEGNFCNKYNKKLSVTTFYWLTKTELVANKCVECMAK